MRRACKSLSTHLGNPPGRLGGGHVTQDAPVIGALAPRMSDESIANATVGAISSMTNS